MLGQIEKEDVVTLTVGPGVIVTVAVPIDVPEQPIDVPVTVYTVVEKEDTFTVLVITPVLHE